MNLTKLWSTFAIVTTLIAKKIEKLHCSENALFKVDGKIVKIYNPLVLSKQKQLAEVMGCERANKHNLPIPKILYTGVIEGE